MDRRVFCALTLLCALGVARSSFAHHPLGELYDRDSTIVVTGTITSIDWVNPHLTLVLAVERSSGEPEMWAVEADPPYALTRRGWTREKLPVGATVTITGFAPLDGSQRTAAREIELATGERLTATTDTSWKWQRTGDRLVAPGFELQPTPDR